MVHSLREPSGERGRFERERDTGWRGRWTKKIGTKLLVGRHRQTTAAHGSQPSQLDRHQETTPSCASSSPISPPPRPYPRVLRIGVAIRSQPRSKSCRSVRARVGLRRGRASSKQPSVSVASVARTIRSLELPRSSSRRRLARATREEPRWPFFVSALGQAPSTHHGAVVR